MILLLVTKAVNNSNTANCILLNAQSLGNKLPELHCLLYSFCYQIILITESWFDSTFTNGLLDPASRYIIFRKDRNRNGGGVCAFVDREFIVSEVCLNSCPSYLEMLCFDIIHQCRPMSVCVCYRPSGYSPECVNIITKMIDCLCVWH